MKNNGTLEAAQQIANHESPRTTKLYDRRDEEISLDEVEKISISRGSLQKNERRSKFQELS